jgi:Protein of unknown function (DUF3105)
VRGVPDDPSPPAAEPTAAAPPPHRRLRRVGVGLLAVLIGLAGAVGLLFVFEGRDTSQVTPPASTTAGPGQLYPDQGHAHLKPGQRPAQPYASDPPTSGPHVPAAIGSDADGTRLSDDQILQALELGDVVVLYGTPRAPAALRALADKLAGPFDPALAASGQALILARRPGTNGVIALAWRHELHVPSARDAALEPFADYWLGRGVGG